MIKAETFKRVKDEIQLDFDDVLIEPRISTINHRAEVDIIRTFKDLKMRCVPIMSANMTQTGTFDVARELLKNKYCATLHKFYSASDIVAFLNSLSAEALEDDKVDGCIAARRLFLTVGVRKWESEVTRLETIKNACTADYSVLIDVPSAYIPRIKDCVHLLRQKFPEKVIAVGNVCTPEQAQELILAGANIVKVGIGPSVVCNTRIKTGCGRPQLSAILDCAPYVHVVGGYVIADGGIKENADFCKAFVAGADFCMSGSKLAGCAESAGEVIEKLYDTNEIDPKTGKHIIKKELYKDFYGMSSLRAQDENYGETTKSGTSEGVESKLIPYTGPIINTLNDISGSLRSCGSYISAHNIEDFSKNGVFYRVNRIK